MPGRETMSWNGSLLVQFLLSMHLEGLVSLLLLFDPHQVVLCTLLQHFLILERHVQRISRDVAVIWLWAEQYCIPKLHWPSWSPPRLPSCSHISWKGRQRSAPQSWGRQWPDPSLQSTVWLTYYRTGSSAVAHLLQTSQSQIKYLGEVTD